MSPALPDGESAPTDGSLPQWVRFGADSRGFGVYVHIPFCSVRCGYCDFNTYTATELGGGASQVNYAHTACLEIDLARSAMDRAQLPARTANTVFFGGGTPTMLPASDLAMVMDRIKSAWGLSANAEVTTEANPDSVTPQYLRTLAEAGFTRVSFGMQSAVPHVLATLERTHDPKRIPDVVSWARDAGLDVSLDLIYGTPGESMDDWVTSLRTAIDLGVEHVSAYALVVEPGTKMAAQVRRGELELPSQDDQAAKYEMADEMLAAAGFEWYEVSNWAKRVDGKLKSCEHNLAYWRGDDWWGIGPGAHSFMGSSIETAPDELRPDELRFDETSSVEPKLAGQNLDQPDAQVPRPLGSESYISDFDETEREDLESNPSDGGLAAGLERGAGVRWWNVKHPIRYAALLGKGQSPAAGRERLTHQEAQLERVMLGIRLAQGLDTSVLSAGARTRVAGHIASGLVEPKAALQGKLVLTRAGRLLADTVIRDLTD